MPVQKTNNPQPIASCPECNSDVLEGNKSYYCSGFANGCKFNIWKTMLINFGINTLPSMWASHLIKGETVQMSDLIARRTGKKISPLGRLQKKENGKYWIEFIPNNTSQNK